MNNQLPALGEPLPVSTHAVSVSLPKWADVVGYETSDPRVINAMKTGYPRFVYNAITKKLFAEAEKKFARADEFCLTFPSEQIAKLCVSYSLGQWNRLNKSLSNQDLRINRFSDKIWAVTFPSSFQQIAKSFWQHAGFITSSRLAEATLENKTEDQNGTKAKEKVKAQLSKLTGEKAENIYLYPSGMAAIFSAYQITTRSDPSSLTSPAYPTAQLGFPYVDTLKIQEKFGSESIFLPYKSPDDLDRLEKEIKEKKIGAVFTEFPCNPLITCVDLEKLSSICRKHEAALVVDDTLSSWANVDLSPYVDITVTSLTKFFSGIGDVLAGSLILNSKSPLFDKLKNRLEKSYEDLLYGDDAVVLETNGRDFKKRIEQINKTAESLYTWLKAKLPRSQILYTKDNPLYEKYKTGGYGGIISIVLPTEAEAIKFFDNLKVNKGPSLGTNYTLACPYTLLAHYHEREFAEKSGVPFHLIRVSIGLEDIESLKATFASALDLSS